MEHGSMDRGSFHLYHCCCCCCCPAVAEKRESGSCSDIILYRTVGSYSNYCEMTMKIIVMSLVHGSMVHALKSVVEGVGLGSD